MCVLKIMYFSLIFVLACAVKIQAVNYDDVELLGAACRKRDSCYYIPARTEFSKRNCECDQFCSAFGDCCVNAPSNRYRDMKLSCMEFSTAPNVGAYVIDKCPRKYAGPVDIRNKCEIEDDFTDPLASTPATSLPIGITYRNRYCAQCNKANLASLRSWNIILTCDTLEHYDVNGTFVWNNIEYRTSENGWGVEFRGEFHFCDIIFDKPQHLPSSKVRMCRANIISTCPRTWWRADVKQACESYMAVVHAGEDSYKNAHCALCNGRITNTLICNRDEFLFRRKKPFSFPMLVDVNMSNGVRVGEVQLCPDEEVYDPFFKKCRPVKCVVPGYTLVDGECVKI